MPCSPSVQLRTSKDLGESRRKHFEGDAFVVFASQRTDSCVSFSPRSFGCYVQATATISFSPPTRWADALCLFWGGGGAKQNAHKNMKNKIDESHEKNQNVSSSVHSRTSTPNPQSKQALANSPRERHRTHISTPTMHRQNGPLCILSCNAQSNIEMAATEESRRSPSLTETRPASLRLLDERNMHRMVLVCNTAEL